MKTTERNMQILIAEDSPVYRTLIGGRLRTAGYVPIIAQDGAAAWNSLQRSDCPELVVMDWMLPSIDGIELCRRVREAGKTQPYVILMSGKTDQKDKVKAIEAGADDYLTKPFDVADLEARLLVGRRVIELRKEVTSAKEAFHYAQTYDALTGVMVRPEVIGLLERELERARKSGNGIAVMMADIDKFRRVNETKGRQYGDQALKEVARRLRSKLAAHDGIGRYGDDEFLVILRDADSVTALVRADDLRNSIAERQVLAARSAAALTVSIGVALAQAPCGYDLDRLLTEAGRGLRVAKSNGRNRVEQVEMEEDTGRADLCPAGEPSPIAV